jgi:acyl carrier protein
VTRDEIRALLLEVLGGIAPEADLAALDPREDLREQLEIDSMDLLNFAIGVHERTGVEIPEVDYPKLASLDSCAAYLESRLRPQPA